MSNSRILHQNSQLTKPELTDQFRDILKHLTDNPEVLASRIALLLYREKMQPVEGAGLNYEAEKRWWEEVRLRGLLLNNPAMQRHYREWLARQKER